MKLRRSVAISAIATVIAAGAVSTAPAAFAATPAPAAATADKATGQELTVSFNNTPAKIVAGGDAVEFQLVVTNKTDKPAVFVPLLALGTEAAENPFTGAQAKVEFKYSVNDKEWHTATAKTDNGFTVFGNVGEADWTFLTPGESSTRPVRVSVAKDAPLGAGIVLGMTASFATDEHGEPIGGKPSIIESGNVFATEFVAAGAPKPSHSASAPASPSASASATATPSDSASASAPQHPSTSPSSSASHGTGATGGNAAVPPAVKDVVKAVTPTPAAVAAAKTQANNRLASTGGGDNAGIIAAAGAAAVVLGAGTLVVLRRRKAGAQA